MFIKWLNASTLTLVVVTASAAASAQSFPECTLADSDPDGDGYGWENNATCRVADPLVPPVITRNDNGQTVNQTRAYWLESDLTADSVTCQSYIFYPDPADSSTGSYIADPFSPVYTHTADGQVTQTINGNFAGTSSWSITDGIYSGAAFMSQTAFVDVDFQAANANASRGWSSAAGYWQCDGAAPTGSPPPTPAPCIDTPPAGDGWGWNGSTSCQIAKPPQCIDTDPVGDGWGWDGTSSCRITTTPVCIDTDPVDDGWGWNGSTSCTVGNPTEGPCVDSEPVGDGWGWNGVTSCAIP